MRRRGEEREGGREGGIGGWIEQYLPYLPYANDFFTSLPPFIARNATLDYLRTVPSILQWIAVEFFTILVFACFGVVLFANIDQQGISGQDAFLSFKNAFISLYALSLTVNDPDVYLVSGEGGREGGREGGNMEGRMSTF